MKEKRSLSGRDWNGVFANNANLGQIMRIRVIKRN